MATINYAFKEVTCKIVYYGPGLGGKTTNLIKIHETIPQKHRGELVSLATEKDRTLFFDFLPLDLGEIKGFRTKFQLYTVPGQVFYNATRKLVLRGVDGVIFVADSAADRMDENFEALESMRANLVEYGLDFKQMPYTVQYNKRDLPNALPIEELQARLNPSGAPHFEAIAIQGVGVKETLKGISKTVLSKARSVASQEASPRVGIRTQVAVPAKLARAQPALEEDTVRVRSGAASAPPQAASQPANGSGMPPRAGDSGRFKAVTQPETAAARADAGARRGETLTSQQARTFLASGIRQRCDLYWRGLRIGKAFVELRARPSRDNHPTYDLNVEMAAIRVVRYRFQSGLRTIGHEIRARNGVEARFATFGSANDGHKEDRSLFLWLRDSDSPNLYLRYYGRRFDLALAPEGKEML